MGELRRSFSTLCYELFLKLHSDVAVDEFTVLINRICNTARTYGVQTWDDLTTKWKQQAQRLSQLSSQRERIRKTNDEVNSRLRFLKENEPKIREKMSAVTAETDHIKQLEKFSTSLLGPILDNIEYESLTEQGMLCNFRFKTKVSIKIFSQRRFQIATQRSREANSSFTTYVRT